MIWRILKTKFHFLLKIIFIKMFWSLKVCFNIWNKKNTLTKAHFFFIIRCSKNISVSNIKTDYSFQEFKTCKVLKKIQIMIFRKVKKNEKNFLIYYEKTSFLGQAKLLWKTAVTSSYGTSRNDYFIFNRNFCIIL